MANSKGPCESPSCVVSEKSKKSTSCSFFNNISFFSTLPKGVFAISLFGLFLGASTTMVYSQLGMFLKHELHANVLKIALIDGFVEFLSFLTRIFSGVISDYLKNRKFILLVGCGITLCMKPLFAVAHSTITIMFAQAIERIGNGLQACPRDALIADISTKETYGQSFGFSKSLKTVGGLFGTMLAMIIMYFTCDNYRIVFFCATIPVGIAILCLLMIKTRDEIEVTEQKGKRHVENPFKKQYLKSLDMNFWKIIILASIFELGHFSEALLPVRANDFIDKAYAGSTSMFISIGQILCSYPVGLYADKIGKKVFIFLCMIMMILANTFMMTATSITSVYIGSFLWGGQMTAIQGIFLSLISEKVDPHLRGTAIGIFYCAIGTSYMIASMVAGDVWDTYGNHYAFLYSITCCVISLCCVHFLLKEKR